MKNIIKQLEDLNVSIGLRWQNRRDSEDDSKALLFFHGTLSNRINDLINFCKNEDSIIRINELKLELQVKDIRIARLEKDLLKAMDILRKATE